MTALIHYRQRERGGWVSLVRLAWIWIGGACSTLLCVSPAVAQEVTLTARVAVMMTSEGKPAKSHEANNVVVWLTPVGGAAKPVAFRDGQQLRLVQRNKSFDPHLLVVPVGSVVAFPNHDPFFHNVFSLFEGKRFDLGLYEAGSTRDVHFNKPGISYVFCNIHPEMSGVVVALDTPYYGISDQQGQVVIAGVPVGKYMLRLWHESALPEALKAMTREVTISETSSTLGVLRLPESDLPRSHKNLYGMEYDSPTPDNPVYSQPN
jgi:plastocyanin